MLGLQGASSTARGKSTQCPSSSHTRHSVEKRKRERSSVFPVSTSIRSQSLQSDQRGGNHTSCSSSVFAWFWPCRRETDVPTKAPALKLDTENWAKGLLLPSPLKRSAETRAGAPCFAAFGAPWSSCAGWRWRCCWRRLHWWEWHSIVIYCYERAIYRRSHALTTCPTFTFGIMFVYACGNLNERVWIVRSLIRRR